jgi:acyl phosphate:glycerol-3-phosphate acyltransferase
LVNYLISILLGYLVGSFPSAYLFVRVKTQKDVRTEGSGIAGTMNSFQVTGSKLVGISVLIVDVLKGVIPILIIKFFIADEFWLSASTGIAAIVGHDFPVWLKFKGGRGLATTAGVMLVFGWIFIASWLFWFSLAYILAKRIHLGNITATVFSMVSVIAVPKDILVKVLPKDTNVQQYVYLGMIICVLILVRHIDSFKELTKSHS